MTHSPFTLPKTLVFALVCAGLAAFLIGVAAWISPTALENPVEHRMEAVEAVEAARAPKYHASNPPVVAVDVDRSEGENGRWYPKAESPILAELVREGKLPPVAERTGPEPVVLDGFEGPGRYGGTWIWAASSQSDIMAATWRLCGASLVRWSPMGYPIRPHLARGWEVSEGGKVWTFHLRKGMRWSDGHPFTASDLEYWWSQEVRIFDSSPPAWMVVRGQVGRLVKVDDATVRFEFPSPHGTLLEALATMAGWPPFAPEHYLRKYHPDLGDDALIEATMKARGITTRRSLYFAMKDGRNTEHPRMWPWVYRTHRASPPESFVRNPYYPAVDRDGHQLPYVDRVQFEVKNPKLIPIAAAGGALTMQTRHLNFGDYTLLMENRERSGYRVLHWFNAVRSAYTLWPNINRRVRDEESAMKARYLATKEFRQALSLAIDRRKIIDAAFVKQGEPAQIDPGPESEFGDERLRHAYVEHDPERANAMLDALGLHQRDREGMRMFPGGKRMVWNITFCDYTGEGPGQFVVDDWAKVGVRAVLRERSRPLFVTEKTALLHDFVAWTGESEFNPMVEPRSFAPTAMESHFAIGYALWYLRGGLYGLPAAQGTGMEPPPGDPARRVMELVDEARSTTERKRQIELFRDVFGIAAENVWSISIATPPPALAVVKDGFYGVPTAAISGASYATPNNASPETFYYAEAKDSPGAVAQVKREMLETTPPPDAVHPETLHRRGHGLGGVLAKVFAGIALLALVLAGVRHPYVGRRLLLMIPTLGLISIVTFTIIQMPPGDFVQTRILELQLTGDQAALEEVQRLREAFHLDEPLWKQYARWMGLRWFVTFAEEDRGLLQGDMGRSMETQRSVNDMVGERVLLTFLVSLATLIFTWAIALPIGIYSAVRQYSLGDYALTFLGFIGMCVPNFLLAILLMYWSSKYLGLDVTGLFSPEFAAVPEWSVAKALDLLKHMWVPVVVIALSGTAGMIRVMRGNLLDELRKPYVTTAMARGVRPFRLLIKYPVRLALNPFLSGIGGIFPQLVSGGAIVAIVLSLPMVGPVLLSGLLAEDLYLASSMLMVLSALGVFGTLVSDLLLMWVDPRIRMDGVPK